MPGPSKHLYRIVSCKVLKNCVIKGTFATKKTTNYYGVTALTFLVIFMEKILMFHHIPAAVHSANIKILSYV
jgi:hypothetical protein